MHAFEHNLNGLVLALLFGLPLAGPASATESASAGGPGARVRFVDATQQAGLGEFHHFSFRYGGDGLAGAAWFDYNNDGRLDLYLPNGKDSVTPGRDGFDNALFENRGAGVFVDVAAEHGVTLGRGSAGVVAADIDNDGDQDIFLTGDGGLLGHNGNEPIQTIDSGVALFLNNGPPDYQFSLMDNEKIGLTNIESTMSAALADLDNDGLLDIFITAPGTRPEGCLPPFQCPPDDTIKLHHNNLFLNRSKDGQIRFQDSSAASRIDRSLSGALANMLSDFNDDGWIDIFVANGVQYLQEPTPVELWENRGVDEELDSAVFRFVTASTGLEPESGWMGLAPADFDADGFMDFFVTNVGVGGRKPHALYRWSADAKQYRDIALQSAIAGPTPTASRWFGWGCTAQDFDLDGRPDIFLAGYGSPSPDNSSGFPNPGTLLMNDAPLVFELYNTATGVDLSQRFTSGVASADYDNDGRVDILIANDDFNADKGVPVLLRNVTEKRHDWVTIRLRGNGTTTNRDAIGARIQVEYGPPATRRRQVRAVYAGTSFLSMDSQWQTFGLGRLPDGATIQVKVDWPDGAQTPGAAENWSTYGPFAANQIVHIFQ